MLGDYALSLKGREVRKHRMGDLSVDLEALTNDFRQGDPAYQRLSEWNSFVTGENVFGYRYGVAGFVDHEGYAVKAHVFYVAVAPYDGESDVSEDFIRDRDLSFLAKSGQFLKDCASAGTPEDRYFRQYAIVLAAPDDLRDDLALKIAHAREAGARGQSAEYVHGLAAQG